MKKLHAALKRIPIIVTIILFFFCLNAVSAAADGSTETIRVVIDGTVHQVSAKRTDGDWYIKIEDIQDLLNITMDGDAVGYANLRTAAQQDNVNYEDDAVLRAAYIWTEDVYTSDASGDFLRAFELGLAPETMRSRRTEQITSTEFRALLLSLINTLAPDNAASFTANVTTYSTALLRGEGFVMAYYAAVCIGADTWNNSFDNSKADGGDFWDCDGFKFDELYPHLFEGPVQFSNTDDSWVDSHAASFLWSFWHSSPRSGYQMFVFNETAQSMRTRDPLTVEEALCALTRLYDSYEQEKEIIPITDAQATTYDHAIITDALLAKANAQTTVTADECPAWTGFVLSDNGSYEGTDVVMTPDDLHNIANWGFNSARIMLTYQTLFDSDVLNVNLTNLKKLDDLIAAAIKYNLNLNLLIFAVPGRWTYYNDTTFTTVASLDLFTNIVHQIQTQRLWALLAQRYKDIPSATLTFTPLWEVQNYNLSSGLSYEPYTYTILSMCSTSLPAPYGPPIRTG